MDESKPAPALDFAALAGMLEATLASEPSSNGDGGLGPGAALAYFGDYELEEEIARGGMGIVYRAKQRTLNRTVAVKVLRDHLFAGGAEVERFKTEAAAAAALRHPHIVGIHEIGEHNGTHFFSMDYVSGGTLSHQLRDGPLPARKAAALMVKIAQAIEHAHSQGVLHRDLKPANVLLDSTGEPLVTDFGLARHAAQETALTVSGQVLGTPAYMAPEQAAGRTKEYGPHTDVYGLGALLYHLCGGRAPFTGDSHLAVMSQVTHDEPVSVRLLNPSIPRDLETICAKAMAKEPLRRYSSALALAGDLQRFLDGKTVRARPVSSVEKLWRWSRRHRALSAALVAIALLTLGVLITVAVSRHRIDGLRREALQRLYAADMRLALQSIAEDKHGNAAPLIQRYASPGSGEDLRGFEWYVARGLNRGSEAASLEPLNGQVRAVAWSPDGRWLAAGANGFRLWEMAGGRPVLHHTSDAPAYAFAFTADSKRLAASRADGEVTVCDPAAPETVLASARFPAIPDALAWRSDAVTLEVLASQMHWRCTPGSGEPQRAGPLGGSARFSTLNATATRGAYVIPGPPGGDEWQLIVRDVANAVTLASVRMPPGRAARSLACSDDGRWLLIGGYTGELSLSEAPFTEKLWALNAHGIMVDKVAFSPDAALIASAGDHVIHLRDRATGALRRVLRGHHATLNSLTFSPDGTMLLSGDVRGGVKLWNIQPPPQERDLPESGLYVSGDGSAFCWSLSADQVQFRGADGTRHVLNVVLQNTVCCVFHTGVVLQASGAAGQEQPLRIMVPGQPLKEIAVPGKLQTVSPDGKWIAWQDKASGFILLSARDGQEPPVQLGKFRNAGPPVFSADSRFSALDAPGGGIQIFDAATGAEVYADSMHRSRVRGRCFSADGTLFASAGFDGVATLRELATGKVLREFTGGSDTLWSVALSPDGTRLAAGTGESTVILWDTATGLETGTLVLGGPPRPLEQLTFTPDGLSLIARGRRFSGPR
jgi:eukaryotic-like serine/threonine-protein kinase